MAHARIPDFSQPVPVRPRPRACAVALPAGDIDRLQRAAATLLDDDMPGAFGAWEAVQPVRPDTDHVRAPRFLNVAGELLTAVLIIAGGLAAYGFLPIA